MLRLIFVVLLALLIGCGDEGDPVDIAVPSAPSLQNNCPAFLWKNTSKMRYIPAGNFQMGGGAETEHHKTPKWTATTDAFYIDTHEVTIGEFLMFVDMTGYKWQDAPNHKDYPHYDFYAYPAQVTWYDAVAYARWVGKRLPTEIEWEKAARGGTDTTFTWGDSQPTAGLRIRIPNTHRWTSMATEGAFVLSTRGRHHQGQWLSGLGFFEDHFTLRTVGSYAPNGYGLFDMLGNLNEWCVDDYNENAYLLLMNGVQPHWVGNAQLGIPATEPAMKVVRGGGLRHSLFIASQRDKLDTVTKAKRQQFIKYTIDVAERSAQHSWYYQYTGFRCVLDLNVSGVHGNIIEGHWEAWKLCE